MLSIKEFFKDKSTLLFFLTFFFLISPGVTYIFIYENALFMALDWAKLVMLSTAMFVPVVFLNTLIYSHFQIAEVTHKGTEVVEGFVFMAMITGFLAYFAIILTYFGLLNIHLNLLFTEVLLIVLIIIEGKFVKNKK